MSNVSPEFASTLDLLRAPTKLERDKGETAFLGATLSDEDLKYACEWISCNINGLTQWENVYAGLIAARILLQNYPECDLRRLGLIEELEAFVLSCHTYDDFRVRIAAGQVLGSLCHLSGLPEFKRYLKPVLDGIKENLEREIPTPTEAEASLRELHLAKERDDISNAGSSLSIVHDTAGWRHLETWIKCLQEMVVNLPCGDLEKVDRSEIRTVIFQALEHTNRFVRETGYDVLNSLIAGHGCYCDPGSSEEHYTEIARHLAVGLSDNWSQVRMAASRACRTFFQVEPPPDCNVADAYPILLPPMCLNRHYAAEGVRAYSQETWRIVTKGEGRQLIDHHLPAVLAYYFQQADADNHAVREAACASIAEVVSRLEPALLSPHLPNMLASLVTCFGDDSWPVRDAACSAIGTLVAAFPKETLDAGYPDLMAKQLLHNLSDCIPSVREGAAFAIAKILPAAHNESVNELYYKHMETTLDNFKNQPRDSHGSESSRLGSKGPGVSHVIVRRGADAHDAKHTDQVMYSCGSLAPKLKKGGGCHDGLHHRPSEPWECADGVVRLIGQLAESDQMFVSDRLLDKLVEAAGHRNYTHYPYFLETACKSISSMCEHLDRVRFKRYLDEFLVILTAAISSMLPLAEAAGEDTLLVLTKCIGVNVLRGRVQNHYDITVGRALLNRLPKKL